MKRVRFIVLLLLIFIFSYFLFNLKTYSYEDVYYYDDLKIGDFIPNNSTIIVDYDYHDASMFYRKYAYICYYSSLEDEDNLDYRGLQSVKCYEVSINSKEKISDYKTIYENESFVYDGWEVVAVKNNYIYLEPTSFKSSIEIIPTKDNEYTLKGNCKNEENALNKWYIFKNVSAFTESELSDSVWDYENNLLLLSEFKNHDLGYTDEVKFTFEAEKGDILYFESKLYLDDYYSYAENLQDNLTIYLDDESILLSESDFYKKNYYVIDNDGFHELKFVFEKNKSDFSYLHLKNLRTLSYIGDESKLNLDKVNNGDNVYYEVSCNDYIMSGELEVLKEEIVDDVIDNNPPTKDYIYKYVILMCLSLLVILVLIWSIKYKRL